MLELILKRILLVCLLTTVAMPAFSNEDENAETTEPNNASEQASNASEQESNANLVQELFNPFTSNYVLIGADSDTSELDSDEDEKNWDIKFQLSFVSQINTGASRFENKFGQFSRFVTRYIGPWFFAYTQESYWDTGRDSAPFRESNYRPELFFRSPFSEKFSEQFGKRTGLYYGWIHESNGRDGDESGGWDRLFLRLNVPFGASRPSRNLSSLNSTWNLDLRLWQIFSESQRNPDIWKYAGSGELTLNVKHTNICPFSSRVCNMALTLRKGGKLADSSYGLVQLEHRVPITKTGIHIVTQLTSGHGYSIERYNQHESAVRIGFQFSDLFAP